MGRGLNKRVRVSSKSARKINKLERERKKKTYGPLKVKVSWKQPITKILTVFNDELKCKNTSYFRLNFSKIRLLQFLAPKLVVSGSSENLV